MSFMVRLLRAVRSFWKDSYTGQNAVPSFSVSCIASATTSFLSAFSFSRRMSMLSACGSVAGVVVADGVDVAGGVEGVLCCASAGAASISMARNEVTFFTMSLLSEWDRDGWGVDRSAWGR